MSSAEPVYPLRLTKSNTMASPTKKSSAIPRPLSELSPSEKRHNSPSWNQTSKKLGKHNDSSPFQSSPLDTATSPRLFWQNRSGFSSENSFGTRSGSPSPTRRSSIERLQKASRVKNSSILALEQKNEYDPTKIPRIERPLAKVQHNAYGGLGIAALRSGPGDSKGHHRSESKTDIFYSPTKSASATSLSQPQQQQRQQISHTRTESTSPAPRKDGGSPMKSSLSSRFRSSRDEADEYDPTAPIGQFELPLGRSLHRHAKSVTFDAAPPQVNEYEMATPDLSSIGSNSRDGSYDSEEDDDDYDDYHFSAGDNSLQEDSFDASLEDTVKTPVVGPEDWRQDTPDSQHRMQPDDVFASSPMSEARPPSSMGHQDARTASSSSAEHRPLPPLPGQLALGPPSPSGISATAERMIGGSLRGPPSLSAAAVSKSEIQNIGHSKMSLEERLRLMMLSDDGKSAAEQQRERRMRRAGARDRDRPSSQTPEPDIFREKTPSVHEGEGEEDTTEDISGLEEYRLPPRISRESIMRRVNGGVGGGNSNDAGGLGLDRESGYHFSSPAAERTLPMDPDVPIPSTEHDEEFSILSDDGLLGMGQDIDTESIRDMSHVGHDDQDDHDEGDRKDEHHSHNDENTSASDYGDENAPHHQNGDIDRAATPRAVSPLEEDSILGEGAGHGTSQLTARVSPEEEEAPQLPEKPQQDMAAADAVQGSHECEQMQRPSTPEQKRKSLPEVLSKPEYDGTGWGDDEEYEEEPSTPESVIHHPVEEEEDYDGDMYDEEEYYEEESVEHEPVQESPAIPEQLATIKASGSKLKTRLSATPSDLVAMREARRQVSREVPDVPPIPERHRNRMSRDVEADINAAELTGSDFIDRHPSFKNRSLTLDLDIGLSLDKDFERVIETQKRGYLMRQNTKLVAASDKDSEDPYGRGVRSAGNSPVKGNRPQSWTVEPWNSQNKSKSVRKRTTPAGAVPPLPGQESNAAALNPLAEEDLAADAASDEGVERGRLFVKVMGVKDLDLPLPRTERSWFSLTLDNGVHCVTTAWLELARNAPIGQEFELLVPNELEFQLTLNVKLEKPAAVKAVPQSLPAKIVRPKTSTFSRVFASPKKRKEMEMRFREEEERQAREHREAQARFRVAQQPTAYDLLSPLVAEDGSFARAYVCLKEHESRCYGRPGVVDIACFNEWATEEAGFANSVKSKRGDGAVVRRAPYKIGKLELQLLFVPRPKGMTNDDMPKSMNSCIREMKAAEERLSRNFEGHLSQQGGDCPYWRRRYFKLVGTKLTAYHEATRQPRATINLANARRLIDDRRTLTEKETTGRNGQRRRSAFAEEEEGYMFVEEGFRIRFNNGEVIDFYADTAEDKEAWMRALSDVISRDSMNSDDEMNGGSRGKGKWCELVIKREEALRKRAEGRRVHSRTKSMYV